jgi:hypothetical protein
MGSFGKSKFHNRSDIIATGAGSTSPWRIRCKRSSCAMARYICRSSFVSYREIFSNTSRAGNAAAASDTGRTVPESNGC